MTAKNSSALALAAAVTMLPAIAEAAAYYWNAPTATTWDAGWSDGSATFIPSASDDLTAVGPNSATGGLTINIASAASANSLSITNTSATNLTNTTSAADQTLSLGAGGLTTGAGTVTIGSFTAAQAVGITLAANQTWNITGGTVTTNNPITGAFSLTKSGTGQLNLSGNSGTTFTGGLTINAGTVRFGNGGAGGSAAITAAGGTLLLGSASNIFVGNAINLSGTNASVALSSGASGNGFYGLIAGTADQTLTVSGATWVNLSSSTKQLNNHYGTVLVPAGTGLQFRSTTLSNGGDNSLFEVNGTLSTRNGGALALGALSGSGTVSMGTSGSNNVWVTYTIGARNSDATFSGVIADGDTANGKRVSVIKTGTGTQTFSGANTYSGGSTVRGGTLKAGSLTAFGTGNVTVDGGTVDFASYAIANPVVYRSGAMLNAGTALTMDVRGNLNSTGFTFGTTAVNTGGTLAGNGTVGALTVNAGGILAPGNSAGKITASSANLLGETSMEIGGLLSTEYDNLTVTGALAYGGTLNVLALGGYNLAQEGSYTLFSFTSAPTGDFTGVTVGGIALSGSNGVWSGTGNGATYNFTGSSGVLAVAVPEPGTIGIAIGSVAVMALRRRRVA